MTPMTERMLIESVMPRADALIAVHTMVAAEPAEPGAPSGEPEAPADGAPVLPELPVPVGGA